jgi:hypothetical protein
MRRLRLLNSLFVAIGKLNGNASPDKDARKANLTFHKQHIAIALGPTKQPRCDKSTEPPKDRLTLVILDNVTKASPPDSGAGVDRVIWSNAG